jgi:hypothetical protein
MKPLSFLLKASSVKIKSLNNSAMYLITSLGDIIVGLICSAQGRGVHVTGVSAAYTFKLNKNILSE